jgi:hypothetical protein
MSELAAMFAGGIGAGIYPTDTPKQVLGIKRKREKGDDI